MLEQLCGLMCDSKARYDFGRLNYEGIRKSLKKYDKVMKTKDQVLQVPVQNA